MNRHSRRVAKKTLALAPRPAPVRTYRPGTDLRFGGRTLRVRLFINTDEEDHRPWLARLWEPVAGPQKDMGFAMVALHGASDLRMEFWQRVQEANGTASLPIRFGGRALELVCFVNTERSEEDMRARVTEACLNLHPTLHLALLVDELPAADAAPLWSRVREAAGASFSVRQGAL